MGSPFWSELRRERFDLDQEALRPWFPLPQVLDGLFGLCKRLFDVEIRLGDGDQRRSGTRTFASSEVLPRR